MPWPKQLIEGQLTGGLLFQRVESMTIMMGTKQQSDKHGAVAESLHPSLPQVGS